MDSETSGIHHLEDLLTATGWGLYYKFLISIACVCHLLRGFTFVTLTYTVLLSSCEDRYISHNYSLAVFTSYLLGCGFGGTLTNFLSDIYGRKRCLVYSMISMFFASFMAAFAYNVYVIVAIAFVLGTGLETSGVQVSLLLVEVLDHKKRGFWVAFCNAFSTVGYYVTVVGLILFETPTVFSIAPHDNEGRLSTWRLMFALSGGVSLLLACVCSLIEESPRYFLFIGKNFLAYLLLKQIYAINNSSFAENFKVKEDELQHLIHGHELRYTEPVSGLESVKMISIRFWKTLLLICSGERLFHTLVISLFKIPLISNGLFQLNNALPKHLAENGTRYHRGLDFVYPIIYTPDGQSGRYQTFCELSDRDVLYYKRYLLLGMAMIPGQLISCADSIDRKYFLFGGWLLSGCCFIILGFVDQTLVKKIAAFLTITAISCLCSVLSLVNLELYPTAVRGTSAAITSVPGYLLAALFLNFIKIEHEIYALTMGILYICLSAFVCCLPESRKRPLVE